MNQELAKIAKEEALKFYHGYVCGTEANLQKIVEGFPLWDMRKWDNHWCAAFVYYCCKLSNIELPIRYPNDQVSCNFAGCIAWEQWACLKEVDRWRDYESKETIEIGDLLLFDNVSDGVVHDHIGIIVADNEDTVSVAEGNFNNVSAIVIRKKDKHIRGVIRMDQL